MNSNKGVLIELEQYNTVTINVNAVTKNFYKENLKNYHLENSRQSQ